MKSPLLPWEIIERVISHSGDHPRTLYSFSLTCHQLRPRVLCFMVADPKFKNRDQIFYFCDFLQDKPHLKPLVRSISVNPVDFAPFPLLHILPNLSEISFVSPFYHDDDHSSEVGTSVDRSDSVDDNASVGDGGSFYSIRSDNGYGGQTSHPIVLNRSILTCCQRFGIHIQTLHLVELCFLNYLEFARFLVAFTRIKHLVCLNTIIRDEGNQAHLDVIKQRLSERLQLLTLDIDFPTSFKSLDDFYGTSSVAALLVDSGLVRSTVEILTVQAYRACELSHPCNWPLLRSLVLKLECFPNFVRHATVFLKDFVLSTLKDVTVELRTTSIQHINHTLSTSNSYEIGEWEFGPELERSLLMFPEPCVILLVDRGRAGTIQFWTQEIGKRLPVLSQREAFIFRPRTVIPRAGHDGAVMGLAVCPDGKWVATWSTDSTVILWDTVDGSVVQQWVPHNYKSITSFTFSLDGRYLLSIGGNSKAKVWDLAGRSRKVKMLKEHGDDLTISCLAWSPRGDILAARSYSYSSGSVGLWHAHTFHEIRVLEHVHARHHTQHIAFSPDGHWLFTRSSHGYHIWNAASGSLHKSFPITGDTYLAPVFDTRNMRFLMPERNMIQFVDIETGEELAALVGVGDIQDVALSPDATLALTGSDDGMVTLWDSHTGVELFLLQGHTGRVMQVCFSPCGKYVASASWDGTVRLWRTRDGSCVATLLEHQDWEALHVAFSPEGETLWSGDSNGTVIMRRMRDIIPIDELRASDSE